MDEITDVSASGAAPDVERLEEALTDLYLTACRSGWTLGTFRSEVVNLLYSHLSAPVANRLQAHPPGDAWIDEAANDAAHRVWNRLWRLGNDSGVPVWSEAAQHNSADILACMHVAIRESLKGD